MLWILATASAPLCCWGFATAGVFRTARSSTSLHLSTQQQQQQQQLDRRDFVASLLLGVAASGVASAPAFANAPAWGPEGDPQNAANWYGLLLRQKEAIRDLLDTWEETAGPEGADGDALRRKLGTVGVSSPLSAVKKAYAGVRDAQTLPEDAELVDFAEGMQEVLTDLSDADNDLYSANFADYSGGGHLKGRNFVKKARTSVMAAQRHFDDALGALNIL